MKDEKRKELSDLVIDTKTVAGYINWRATMEGDLLQSEIRYEIAGHEIPKKRYVISITGMTPGIENLGYFLREINRYWQEIPSHVEQVQLDLSNTKYAGSTFYGLIAVMAVEHKRKYNKQLILIANQHIMEKIRLFTYDRILRIKMQKRKKRRT